MLPAISSSPYAHLNAGRGRQGHRCIFNHLYQQGLTDVNTTFKVFRRGCIAGVEFVATGFSFDISLACILVKERLQPGGGAGKLRYPRLR